jgi:hypothetical protein
MMHAPQIDPIKIRPIACDLFLIASPS